MLTTTNPQRSTKRLVLHPGQVPVFLSPARFRVLVAGRRWGKTELSAVVLISSCLKRPGVYRYVAPNAVLARRTIWRRKLRRVIHQSWLLSSPNETRMEYHFRNGSILEVMGAEDPTGLLGEGVSGIVLDEYASMKGEVWTEYVLPSLADEQGWALFTGTPKSFNHFYDLYEYGRHPDYPEWDSWQFKSADNPLLDADVIASAKRVSDERTFKQEWEASFETIAGRAYYAFDSRENVSPVIWDAMLPAHVSFDFNVEPASAIVSQVQGDRACVWREVQLKHRGGEATQAVAMRVSALLSEVKHRGQVRIYGDATGRAAKTTGPADHAVLRSHFSGALWCIGRQNPHEKDRVAAVNAMCQTAEGHRRLVIDPSCVKLQSDLEQVIYADNGELDKKSNPMLTHLSDALGYWVNWEWPTVSRGYIGTVEVSRASGSSAIEALRSKRRRNILGGRDGDRASAAK